MGIRRQGRELALQILYLMDITKLSLGDAILGLTKQKKPEKKSLAFSQQLAEGTQKNKTQIDTLIRKYTTNWDMDRMAVLDRNILRLGTYEILHEKSTPVSVAIDEAVEIAKTYSTLDSGKFVNGILDKVKLERKD